MPRAFTQHEKELIGRRLLQHGYRLFSVHGLDKTNVEELARAAGISKGAFYKFYDSKEALFFEIIEQAEVRLRAEVMAAVERPGPTPRARLLAALKKAFAVFDEMPILQLFTGADFELVFSRVSAGELREHLDADRLFIDQFIAHCRAAGIPIRVDAGQMTSLLYPLVLAFLHKQDLGPRGLAGDIDVLLELVAAYCLGEIRPEGPPAKRRVRKDAKYEPAH